MSAIPVPVSGVFACFESLGECFQSQAGVVLPAGSATPAKSAGRGKAKTPRAETDTATQPPQQEQQFVMPQQQRPSLFPTSTQTSQAPEQPTYACASCVRDALMCVLQFAALVT
jgi:hypothetical protein